MPIKARLLIRPAVTSLFITFLMAGTTVTAQRPAAPNARPTVNPTDRIQAFFNRLDRDKDGVLGTGEIPEPLAARLSSMDRNRDGTITAREFTARFAAGGNDNSRQAAGDNNAPARPQAGRGGGSRSGRSGSRQPAAGNNNAPARPQAGRGGGSRSGRSGSRQGDFRQHDGSTPSRGQDQPGPGGPQAQQGQRGPQKPGQHRPQGPQRSPSRDR